LCLCSFQLFERVIKQFDRLYSRKAFLENYRQESMFSDGLEEFEHSREILDNLVQEYKESEKESYINWGLAGDGRMGLD
jgi:tubulin gamma